MSCGVNNFHQLHPFLPATKQGDRQFSPPYSNPTLSTHHLNSFLPPPHRSNPSLISHSRSRRAGDILFVLMSISFAGLGIMSIHRSLDEWSDIVQGKGEIRSLFFALLVSVVVLVLGELGARPHTCFIIYTHTAVSPHQPTSQIHRKTRLGHS